MTGSGPDAIRVRSRLVGGGALVGGVVSVLGWLVTVGATADPERATTTTFALAALVLGFAVLGWSGSVMAGRGIENMQRYLETGSRWSERDSRRAMSRIAGFGAGGMLGITLLTILL